MAQDGKQPVSALPKPLVSIITPVYNGESYLRECIESVLSQTYQNWQYTIVNNCSTDRSLQIAQEYARGDARIRVVDETEHLAVIENHNRALEYMEPAAKYCKPLMADDWLYPECVQKMVERAEQDPSVGLVCSYALAEKWVTFVGLPYSSAAIPGRVVCRMSLLEDLYAFGSPTTMLIRSDLVRKRKPFYNVVNLHADEESCYDILQESDFSFINQVLAFNRVHEGSLSAKTLSLWSQFVGRVYVLVKYGGFYLTESEQRRRCVERFDEYYRRLAVAALHPRQEGFWEYHKRKLELLGAPLDRRRLANAMFMHVLKRCFAGFSVFKGLFVWWPSVKDDSRAKRPA